MVCSSYAIRLKILRELLVMRLMVPSFRIMGTAMGSVLFSSNSEQPLEFDNFLAFCVAI